MKISLSLSPGKLKKKKKERKKERKKRSDDRPTEDESIYIVLL
jgi:hypothetical protein